MNSYDLFPDPLLTDQFGNVTINEPSRAQLGLPPQPPQSKNTGAKAGAEAALMFADAQAVQRGATKLLGTGVSTKAGPMAAISRFAASPAALTAAKVGTGISALGGVLGAADVLVGQDSAANKAMDTAAMGIGGFLGAAGGPMGIAAGAGIGKAVSDGAQFIFGGGKSAEQRKLEEALIALKRGGLV
jgi:hypothetical protein